MAILQRRRFIASTTTTSVLGGLVGCLGFGMSTPDPWELTLEASVFSTIASVARTPDGYLVAGTIHDESPAPEGFLIQLDRDGTIREERRYISAAQRAIRADQPRTGPMPADWLSLARPVGAGSLLVGWTYYDGPAVEIARIFRTDASGAVLNEVSLGSLPSASAMSYLSDGVRTSEGFLLCGTESPVTVGGGTGWLVWVREDGTIRTHRRYPATERDLRTTVRRDSFYSITKTQSGYIVCGSYEPAPEAPPRAWVVGLAADGSVRWQDVPPLEGGGSEAFAVTRSDRTIDDVVVVGVCGETVTQHRWVDRHPVPEGDGFAAAYTDDGERMWLEEYLDTPLMEVMAGPGAIHLGGSRTGHRWVGTLDRTTYQSSDRGTIVSLCRGDGPRAVAGGRRLVDGTPMAWIGEILLE